jgi:hypothetical protein
MIDHRKNSWELYGFDYMVDSDFNAWLIEINSSPACDYSTKVTESYVQRALVELLSVTLDCREWDNAPRKTRGERPETGGWECIYKGPLLETPVASFGAGMKRIHTIAYQLITTTFIHILYFSMRIIKRSQLERGGDQVTEKNVCKFQHLSVQNAILFLCECNSK